MSSAFWDQRYAEPDWAYGTAPNDFLVQVRPSLPPGDALCLAEGQGRNALYLAAHGWQVEAVDVSAVGMARAREAADAQGLRLRTVVADLAVYALEPASWDVIVSIFGHLPPPLRADVHRRAVAALRPGGAFVLEAYSPRQLDFDTGGPRDAALLMTTDDLRRELDGLAFEILHETEREVYEGTYHHGRAAVVQVLAQKD